MVISPENILLVGAILLFLSVLVGKTGAKFGVPALLLFLVLECLPVQTVSVFISIVRK